MQIVVTQNPNMVNAKAKRSFDKFNTSGMVIGYDRRSPSEKDTKATSGSIMLRKKKP